MGRRGDDDDDDGVDRMSRKGRNILGVRVRAIVMSVTITQRSIVIGKGQLLTLGREGNV